MSVVPHISSAEVGLRLALAALLGGAIGFEREFHEHEAGLRTHMLVSVGSALFTIVSAYGFHEFLIHNGGGVVRADPARIAAQIVTGIGFLGAGAIIRQGTAVRGLTTAATLWVVAAIGLAAGAGYYSAALMTTLAVVFLLWPMRHVARRFVDRPNQHRLSLHLTNDATAGPIVETLERLGVQVDSVELGDERTVDLVFELPRGISPNFILHRLVGQPAIDSVAWKTA